MNLTLLENWIQSQIWSSWIQNHLKDLILIKSLQSQAMHLIIQRDVSRSWKNWMIWWTSLNLKNKVRWPEEWSWMVIISHLPKWWLMLGGFSIFLFFRDQVTVLMSLFITSKQTNNGNPLDMASSLLLALIKLWSTVSLNQSRFSIQS